MKAACKDVDVGIIEIGGTVPVLSPKTIRQIGIRSVDAGEKRLVHQAGLEVFEVDGITINGVDIISWNDAGLITHFKVMVRPLKAINTLHAKMGEYLMQMGADHG